MNRGNIFLLVVLFLIAGSYLLGGIAFIQHRSALTENQVNLLFTKDPTFRDKFKELLWEEVNPVLKQNSDNVNAEIKAFTEKVDFIASELESIATDVGDAWERINQLDVDIYHPRFKDGSNPPIPQKEPADSTQ